VEEEGEAEMDEFVKYDDQSEGENLDE